MQPVRPGYKERQDAQVLLQAKRQIEYCEQHKDEPEFSLNEDQLTMARQPKKATQALKLTEALAFVEAATGNYGQATYEFVNLQNKRAVCFDGTMSAGMEIEEELTLAPKLDTLKKALGKTGKMLTLTELPSGRLSVKGEKIQVQVPCVDASTLPPIGPDKAIAPVSNNLKEAFKALEGILKETGDRVFETALLLEANTATATDGKICMQYWHGIDLPPNLVLPRPFVQAVAKQFKNLVAFGYNEGHSVTFWFEDGSWYKTQVYQDPFANCNAILDITSSPTEPPLGLWEACKEVAEFHKDEWVDFKDNAVIGGVAKYPVEGLQGGKQFDYKLLKKIIPHITTCDLATYGDRMVFFGDNIRGVMMAIKHQTEEQEDESQGT